MRANDTFFTHPDIDIEMSFANHISLAQLTKDVLKECKCDKNSRIEEQYIMVRAYEEKYMNYLGLLYGMNM